MADKKNPLRALSLLFLLVLLFFLLIDDSALSPAITYEKEIEKDVYLAATDNSKEPQIFALSCANEALITFYFHLFPNSTNNITLLVSPESVWNVTSIKINLGEAVNVTVTNGFQDLDPDVGSIFILVIQRINITDEVWAYLYVGVITRGWQKAPWLGVVVVPGIFTLVVLYRRRHQDGC
jgi:hypothetical protein